VNEHNSLIKNVRIKWKKNSKLMMLSSMASQEKIINTGLQLEVYGWALCFAHEDRQKMMSSFLNKASKR
jgi:3-hydroxypropionyl-coenzyme A dehydratase